MKRKRVLIVTDVHFCQEDYGGISRDEKAVRTIRQINEEYQKDPFEVILFLGDYSLDHWAWSTKGSWLTEGKSYTKEFIERFCNDLPTPYYIIPGNHEQYGERTWRELTGFDRNMEVIVGDYLFILWDSFGGDLDPTAHSDGTYTPIDPAKTRTIMNKYPDKRVFLCSHLFKPTNTPEEIALINDPRIICLFQGHTHQSHILTLPKEYGSKLILQAGGWSHTSPSNREPWGVRDLYLEDHRIVSRYLVQENILFDQGKPYHVPARCQDEAEILF